jgi:hypothetical protein
MSISSRVLLLPLVALTAACVPTMRAGPSPFDEAPAPTANDLLDMSVIVTNNHWLPMRVWVEWPDRDYFLGDVEPGSRGTFTVPGYLVARSETLRLFADPTGSIDQVLSDPIDVTRGHRIEWQLQKVLSSSRARIM